jgi:hypothetical protein
LGWAIDIYTGRETEVHSSGVCLLQPEMMRKLSPAGDDIESWDRKFNEALMKLKTRMRGE